MFAFSFWVFLKIPFKTSSYFNKKTLKHCTESTSAPRVVFTDVILFNAIPAINRNGPEWRHLEQR